MGRKQVLGSAPEGHEVVDAVDLPMAADGSEWGVPEVRVIVVGAAHVGIRRGVEPVTGRGAIGVVLEQDCYVEVLGPQDRRLPRRIQSRGCRPAWTSLSRSSTVRAHLPLAEPVRALSSGDLCLLTAAKWWASPAWAGRPVTASSGLGLTVWRSALADEPACLRLGHATCRAVRRASGRIPSPGPWNGWPHALCQFRVSRRAPMISRRSSTRQRPSASPQARC